MERITRRNRHAAQESRTLFCPFCSRSFTPEDVLFCDEHPIQQENSNDPIYNEFDSNIIDCATRQKDEQNPFSEAVSLAPRKRYLFHYWHAAGVPEHLKDRFEDPIDILSSDGVIPSRIRIRRANGLEPVMLVEPKAQPNPSPQQEAPQAAESQPMDADTFDFGAMNTPGFTPAAGAETGPQTSSAAFFTADTEHTLQTKACPRCHCVLPAGFGENPMVRIVLLGGPASGKTTYMTIAVTHLLHQISIPDNLILSARLTPESQRYYDYFHSCLLYNKIEATVKDMNDKVKVAFPLVLNIEAMDPDGGSEPLKYILAINDCPGEALNDDNYLINFPAITQAAGVIFLMDALQLANRGSHEELIRHALLRSGQLRDAEGNQPDDRTLQIAVGNYAYCTNSLSETLQTFVNGVTNHDYPTLQAISMTLNKLDLITGSDECFPLSPQTLQRYDRLSQHDLAADHQNGFDLGLTGIRSFQTKGLIESELHNSNFVNQYKRLCKTLDNGSECVAILCTSIHNFNQGDCAFVDNSKSLQRKQRDSDYSGYRLTEPLFFILARLGLVRNIVGDNDPPEGHPIKTGIFGFLGNLFGFGR